MAGKGPRGRTCALVVVDVQNDFVSGSLAVPEARQVAAQANRLRAAAEWRVVALTQDWHPRGHVSFHSTHAARLGAAAVPPVFAESELEDGTRQILWPDHCVQGSEGAAFVADLRLGEDDLVVRKGADPAVDSYSAFFDNERRGETVLRAELAAAGVTDVYVCGLALDFCVGATALDAASLGFRTHVVVDATRAVTEAGGARMLARLRRAGVSLPHAVHVESGQYGPRAAAEDYMERHGVQGVFEHLVARLVLERPENPRAFMADELERLRDGHGGAVPAPLVEGDVRNAFAALDPAGTGRITTRQASRALEHMGVAGKDVPAAAGAADGVTHEQFQAFARAVGLVQQQQQQQQLEQQS